MHPERPQQAVALQRKGTANPLALVSETCMADVKRAARVSLEDALHVVAVEIWYRLGGAMPSISMDS